MKQSRISNYHEVLALGLSDAFKRYVDAATALNAARTSLDLSNPEEVALIVSTGKSVEMNRAAFILFTSSYLEALINAYLIMVLSREEFAALERLNPVEKWTIGPRMVDRVFQLETGRSPHQELSDLFDRRNAIVHHKPQYDVDGVRAHKGFFPAVHSDEEGTMQRFKALPEKLLRLLPEKDGGVEAFMLAFSSGLDGETLNRIAQKKK